MLLKANCPRSWSLFAMVTLILISSFDADAAPGDLDPSFGNGGKVISAFTKYSDQISSIQVQRDGKIITSGYSYGYDPFCPCSYAGSGFIARYDTSGRLDTSFGTNGFVLPIDNVANSYYSVLGVKTVLQPDGKLVAIGDRTNYTAPNQVQIDFAVWRYKFDGTLDTSFGTDGKVSTPVGTLHDWARDVVIQPDGKIVVMGLIAENGNGSVYKFGIVRYNDNGLLDSSFGTGGKVITDLDAQTGYSSEPRSLLIQPDGKILLAADRYQPGLSNMTLLRYNSNGSLDQSFGASGRIILTAAYDVKVSSAALQPNGKVLVSGYSTNGYDYFTSLIVRCNSDGTRDDGFGQNGVFYSDGDANTFNQLALQADGKIIGAGAGLFSVGNKRASHASSRPNAKIPGQAVSREADDPTRTTMYGFTAVRLTPDGAPDMTFGPDGRQITPVGTGGSSFGLASAVQADGKILTGGVTDWQETGVGEAAMLRYAGDNAASRIVSFDFDGDQRSDVSVFRPCNSG